MSLIKRFKLWNKKTVIEREFEYNISLHGYNCEYYMFEILHNQFSVETVYVSNLEQKRARLKIDTNARNKEIIKIVHDFFIEHNVDAHEIEVGK